ncbi:MAG TPA: hypothetical protein VGE84_03765 [Allosphingosinicella sp.]
MPAFAGMTISRERWRLRIMNASRGLKSDIVRRKHIPMQRRGLLIRSIWAACLLLAGLNHARILLQYGLFWDYSGVGWASAAYWSSLTILDPLVAAFLFARPRIGVPGAIVLIATNVLHNLAVTAQHAPEGQFLTRVASSPQIISQIGFLLFVGAIARIAWIGVRSAAHSDAVEVA